LVIFRYYSEFILKMKQIIYVENNNAFLKNFDEAAGVESNKELWQRFLDRLSETMVEINKSIADPIEEKNLVTPLILLDCLRLIILNGKGELAKDMQKIKDENFEPEFKIPGSPGNLFVDIRPEHFFFRGFNKDGAPLLSIIDMYHLGSGELEYKKEIHGDNDGPMLKMGP